MSRTIKNLSDDAVLSTETYTYDAAGNLTSAPDDSFAYDVNNRLVTYNGETVSYDLDGNMLSNGEICCTYDSSNRLITADGHTYTYNAENVRIRNLCEEEDTTYAYDTNCKLSRLLMKTTNGVTTKYVYGRGLIGEEVNSSFKTYHFDSRGSTIAVTDLDGNITDTFAYDTYGRCMSRTGTSEVIFTYNGRDGVITEANGLIYMRARYYSPDMRRFVNADIVAGKLSKAVTLNRFAYANGNPVSFVDPFGLSAERGEYKDSDKDRRLIFELAIALEISYEHARIIFYSQQWGNLTTVEWTNLDIIEWKIITGNSHLFNKKQDYITNYKDVLQDAALKYDIPVFLLAAVAYTEFGGDPMWIDDLAYAIRTIDWSGPDWIDNNLTVTKNPLFTSFGNTSIQVRRALEMLDYDNDSEQKNKVIESLKDPIQNIYMAAKHLDILRNVDFSGKSSDELTDDEIQIIASRYNLGPDCSLETAQEWSYGASIIKHKEEILTALS